MATKKKPIWKPKGSWIHALIPDEMRRDIEAIATREVRTISAVVRLALSKFIVEDQARRKLKG